MRLKVMTALAALVIPVTGHCAKPELPSNVTLRDADKRNSYLEAIDFSYQPASQVAFSALKLCVAENITNNAVTISDTSGSFVGPATGNYYSNAKSQTVQGAGIFKYMDDSAAALIATGTIDGGSTAWGLTRSFLKFDLKAAVAEKGITLKFSNILRAQQNTGLSANDGFQPVGTWKGAKPLQVYAALEGVAEKVKACAQ